GSRALGAAEHSSLTIPHDHRGVGAAAVDAEQDGRMGGWADGPFGHAVPPICPSARLPDPSDEIIPTVTVTAVPSGTYHGQARPRSQCRGKCGITAPRTTGDIRMTLTAIATITSIWRVRGQAPPRMYVPSKLPYVSDAILSANCTTGVSRSPMKTIAPITSTAVQIRVSQRPTHNRCSRSCRPVRGA